MASSSCEKLNNLHSRGLMRNEYEKTGALFLKYILALSVYHDGLSVRKKFSGIEQVLAQRNQ